MTEFFKPAQFLKAGWIYRYDPNFSYIAPDPEAKVEEMVSTYNKKLDEIQDQKYS